MTVDWETTIGLEIHVQLSTCSKIFSGASTAYGAAPNTQACAVDLGLPGVLPVLNQEAVRMAVKLGLAIEAKINRYCVFSRKNYFYPDLPKGYQISQFELPIVANGAISIALDKEQTKMIRITRAHLEEDAGKSIHDALEGSSFIDLNRAGTPLLEIVSEPDMHSASEAVAYLKKIHTLAVHLGICDGNMQEGSFRCDANVSVSPVGSGKLGTRTELKNINSFRFVERAINHEVERHIGILEGGGRISQETRLYDPNRNETRPMRQKEEANDYRYFPDPDLPPLELSEAFIDEIKATLPELPEAKAQRFRRMYSLSEYEANLLTTDPNLAGYYEQTVSISGGQKKLSANWIISEVLGALNRHSSDIVDVPISSERLGKLVARIADNTVSGKAAKDVFEAMWSNQDDPEAIINTLGLTQLSDTVAIEAMVDDVLQTSQEQITQYVEGNHKIIGYFVGRIMKASAGRANPHQVNELLRVKLETYR